MVTLSHKRYVIVCIGCDLLAIATRSDKLTCSTACRVRAHRSGKASDLRGMAVEHKVHPAMIQQAKAINRLQPDLMELVHNGKLTIEDAQPLMVTALFELISNLQENYPC